MQKLKGVQSLKEMITKYAHNGPDENLMIGRMRSNNDIINNV